MSAERSEAEIVEAMARAGHDEYERVAPEYGWGTQEQTRVPWDDLPESNRAVMRAAYGAALRALTEFDAYYWVGTWHVRHADGTEEDIILEHGNLVEDAKGSCGQFLLSKRGKSQ